MRTRLNTAVAAVILAGIAAVHAGAASAGLEDGWEKVVPVPSPLVGEGDRYVVRVERGWLQVRRETADGVTDWHVVLCRATDPAPPEITAPAGGFRFSVSYRGGRYFVREDLNVLRCLRERKPTGPGAWPALPFDPGSYLRSTGGEGLGLWRSAGGVVAAAGRGEREFDCLVRLAPEAGGRSTAYEQVKHSPLARVACGPDWAIDDGKLLVAQRTLAALRGAALEAGRPAPPLAAEGLDGGEISLEDFRGRYVLLDFWATWCGPCVEELSTLKAVAREFGGDRRLAMIGLSLDVDADAPRKFLHGRGIAWTQGFLGGPEGARAVRDFEAESIPQVVLIGPDGTVLARGLRGAAIREAVARALSGR